MPCCRMLAPCHPSHAVQSEVKNSTQELKGGQGHCLDVSQHELARLLVQQRGHVSLLVGVSRHHQPLYCGGGESGGEGPAAWP